MMRLIFSAVVFCGLLMCWSSCFAGYAGWQDGGPAYIYVKPIKKSPLHMPYDEGMKCAACHSWDGVDAYTSATMSLTKSTSGRLPRDEI
ncbi:MAG: hypothetical protein FJ119_12255, partial [Deltaproteobacteria bacterium]|nr:hypothetical protein [Deltaproteobacteria bacterium]